MTTDFRNRRRNFYIKKEFQRNFILKFCALVVLGALVSGAIVYLMSKSTLTTTFENSRLTMKSTADFILPALIASSVVVVILVGVATILITLLTSHKIAGALYAIEKRVDEVAAGNLKTEFHLRERDQVKPLAVGLNVMVFNLRNSVKDLKKSVAELEKAVSDGASGVSSGDITRKLEEVKSKLGKLTT